MEVKYDIFGYGNEGTWQEHPDKYSQHKIVDPNRKNINTHTQVTRNNVQIDHKYPYKFSNLHCKEQSLLTNYLMKVQLYTYLTSVPLWRNQLNIWKNTLVVPYENNYLVSPIWEDWLNMINTLINAARTNQTSRIKPFAKTVKESFKPFTIFTKHSISAI